MCFYLVYHRFDFAALSQIYKTVRIEITQADSTRLTCFISFFHSPISAVVVVKRLVNQQQIHIVTLQLTQGFVDRSFRPFITGIGNPDFGGNENFFTGNAAFLHGIAYTFFIGISLCCIDRTVTYTQSICNAAFTLLGCYLINAVAQHRHFDPIIQFYCIHHFMFSFGTKLADSL